MPQVKPTSISSTTHSRPGARFAQREIPFFALFLSPFYVPVGMQLYPIEFALLGVVSAAALSRQPSRLPASIWWALLVWMVGTVVSDLYFDVHLLDRAKGIARVGLLATTIYSLNWLVLWRGWSVVAMWTGLAAGSICALFIQPNPYYVGEPWKFGWAIPLTLICVILTRNLGSNHRSAVLVFLATLHITLGFRSLGLVVGALALVSLIASRKARNDNADSRKVPSSGVLRPIALVLAVAALAFSATVVYENAALSGSLGEQQQTKAEYQGEGEYGSLASGRVELFLSLRAIEASPLLGGGSFSVASPEAVRETAADYARLGYFDVAASLLRETPTYHSELLGSWAENGVGAVPFWILILIMAFKVIKESLVAGRSVHAVATFAAAMAVWDVWFSPFGADRRVWTALTLVTLIAALRKVRNGT